MVIIKDKGQRKDFTMKLDKYQKEAVETVYKKVLVVAAPGSGKTTVIINRVAHLINVKKVSSNNIIVITFTKAAADNMRKRYMKTWKGNTPFFGTFHGLCYKILIRFIGRIKIIDTKESYSVIKGVLERYIDDIGEEKINEALNNISLFKCSFQTMDDFESSLDKEAFKSCYEEYERYKATKSLIDFDDMQIMVKTLLENNPQILKQYRTLFKYILVDEFQDCDDIQIYLLKLFLGEDNNIFAVGDEDQCIYSFRGSKPEYMVNFEKEFCGGEKYYLNYNYRSRRNIVDVSKRLIMNNVLRNNKNIAYFKEESGDISNLAPFNESSEGEIIIDKIINKHKEGSLYGDNAILYRTNMESRTIIDVCIRRKIPFLLLDKEYNFFNHFICKDILSYLKLSVDPYDKNSFIRIINKPFRYISKNTLDSLMKYEFEESCFNIMKGLQNMAPFQLKVFDNLSKDINMLNKMSLKSAVDYILMDLGYMEYLREYTGKFKLNISELEDIVEEFKVSLGEYNTINMFLAHVMEVEEQVKKNSRASSEDRVILSTIHGVKGMEFKNVYIINCVEDCIPHRRCVEDKESIEEERRLFYVGITRAIEGLYLCSPKTLRGKTAKISSFIKECQIEEKIDYGEYKEGIEVFHRSFGQGIVKTLENNNIVIDFQGIERTFNFPILVNSNLIKIHIVE